MKNIFFLLALFSGKACFTQDKIDAKPENGIYLTLRNYTEANLFLPFINNSQGSKFREPIGHPNEIWIKTEDSTYKFYFEDIWGYRREGIDWRIYNNNAYRIEDTSQICIYSMPTFITYTPGITNFFSKDLAAPIHPLERKELVEVYHSNQSFIDHINKLPWYESIMKWDKNKHQFEFLNWLH